MKLCAGDLGVPLASLTGRGLILSHKFAVSAAIGLQEKICVGTSFRCAREARHARPPETLLPNVSQAPSYAVKKRQPRLGDRRRRSGLVMRSAGSPQAIRRSRCRARGNVSAKKKENGGNGETEHHVFSR